MDIPYARLLGLDIEHGEGAPVLVMPFDTGKLGRPGFLHGGAIGGLLEMAAVAALLQQLDDASAQWKPINVTVDYMRGGRELPTRARGRVTRLGSRIANVEAIAWQESPEKPIAAARMNIMIKRK
nr:PaaI family thioesterase [Sphingosinithalassobacter portus]